MRFSFLLFFFLFFTAPVANAVCTFPDGTEGEIVYNENYHIPQYCDGNEWIAFAPKPGDGMAAWDKDGPTSGLVGWWKLDETSGTFADSSVNSNTGTQTGGVTYGPAGMINNAINFDALDDEIMIPHDDTLQPSDWTIAGWFKSDGTHPYGQGAQKIIGRGPNSSPSRETYEMDFNEPENSLRCSFNPGYDYRKTPNVNDSVSVGVWHHGVCVYNSSENTLTSYLDGTLLAQTNTASATPYNGNANTYIGRAGFDGFPEYFYGSIDDVRIYDRALSAREVKDLYATGGPCSHPPGHEGDMIFNKSVGVMQYCEGDEWVSVGTCAATDGPALHLKFDETTGDPLDSSGANTAVTATGTVWQPTGGVDGSGAIEFDDVSDAVNAGNVLSDEEEITLSVWIYPDDDTSYRIWTKSNNFFTNRRGDGSLQTNFQRWGSAGIWSSSGNIVSAGQWHHIAMTYSYSSVTNTPKLYINGNRVIA